MSARKNKSKFQISTNKEAIHNLKFWPLPWTYGTQLFSHQICFSVPVFNVVVKKTLFHYFFFFFSFLNNLSNLLFLCSVFVLTEFALFGLTASMFMWSSKNCHLFFTSVLILSNSSIFFKSTNHFFPIYYFLYFNDNFFSFKLGKFDNLFEFSIVSS